MIPLVPRVMGILCTTGQDATNTLMVHVALPDGGGCISGLGNVDVAIGQPRLKLTVQLLQLDSDEHHIVVLLSSHSLLANAHHTVGQVAPALK
jgi:hypothetical protein